MADQRLEEIRELLRLGYWPDTEAPVITRDLLTIEYLAHLVAALTKRLEAAEAVLAMVRTLRLGTYANLSQEDAALLGTVDDAWKQAKTEYEKVVNDAN